ncbi:MAG TPA: hypothetical protein VD886_02595, partial [Herpetosiphonaceae bacterium]|nr:hypothetical protein [Herpetosiphonaceae bacterium]
LPSTGDDWFVDDLSFDPPAIALGVLVEPFENGVRLTNSTDTPLYVAEVLRPNIVRVPIPPVRLAAPLGVRQRVLAGEVAYWDSAARGRPRQWNTVQGANALEYSGSMADQWLPGFARDGRRGDARPAGVALPPAKTYMLNVIYGDELFAIPVTQTYRLNPGYVPDRVRTEQAACDGVIAQREHFIIGSLICGAMLVIGFVVLAGYGLIRLFEPAA